MKLPHDLRERLSRRISLGDMHEIIYLIQEDKYARQELYDFIFDDDDAIVTNALWIMTHFSLHENKWLYAKQNEMIDKVMQTSHPSHLRLLLSLLYRQPLANPPRIDFLDYCLEEMIAQKQAPGTTVLCLKLAYEMCRTIPELLQEYGVSLDMLNPVDLPPSLRTARRNVLKAMPKRNSLQIY